MPEIKNFSVNDFALLGHSPVRASKGERTSFLPSALPILCSLSSIVIANGVVHA